MDLSLYRKKRRRVVLKCILATILILLIIVIAYALYVLFGYKRIDDMQYLEPDTAGSYSYFSNESKVLDSTAAYNVMTYNIGFGAYTQDYSSVLDGGKNSWAKSEESLMANICEIANVINRQNPDFLFLQEIDRDGTRTYHVDEVELINQFVKGYYYIYGANYDSLFYMYPLIRPFGANKSGLATYSRYSLRDGIRRSLPIPTDFSKFMDLDRCYTESKVLMDNGKYLCLFNVHLSAYSSDATVRTSQIDMLLSSLESEYKLGNYVICGGDFNYDVKTSEGDDTYTWTRAFPRDRLPKGLSMAIDTASPENIEHNSCRNANEPYNEETSYTATIDTFIISDNISVNFYTNADWEYEFSDHDPVVMQVMFK